MNVLKEQEHLIESENVEEKDQKVIVKDKLSLDDEDKKPEEDEKKSEQK
ncbi:hypothetical protein WICPIJ_006294 [Wickerhamomyces pijperi]|uniref:Uncharacterized protein n=1 Tax=Wickerhamomyces pijperi TaxID=599730 RepID=A0A9P8Q1Y9_WICPI|nr:hypothetical protein WICPIJ_006294 [Wickerhamomyces pijperi]